MVIPWIIGAVGAGVSHAVTKSSEEKKSEEKLELLKKLANLTPDQAAAVEAMKKQPVEELETRAILGIDPRQPLPEQASERAREVHAAIEEARERGIPPAQVLAERASKLTPEEKAELRTTPPERREAAIRDLVTKKAVNVAQTARDIEQGNQVGPPMWLTAGI